MRRNPFATDNGSMRPLTETEVRDALANATDEERREFSLPLDFLLTEWDGVEAIGWRDPRFPARGYLVVEHDDDPVAVVVHAARGANSRHRAAICNLCHTQQPADQVALFSARRSGDAGAKGDTVGTYICADLSCEENVRLPVPPAPSEVQPAGFTARRAEGFARRARAFVSGVLGG